MPLFQQQLSELSNGALQVWAGAPLKHQALKQTHTDNKEGDTVLKLGSWEPPINLVSQDSSLHI